MHGIRHDVAPGAFVLRFGCAIGVKSCHVSHFRSRVCLLAFFLTVGLL